MTLCIKYIFITYKRLNWYYIFILFTGPVTIRSAERIRANEWTTIVAERNQQDGSLSVNNGVAMKGTKCLSSFPHLCVILFCSNIASCSHKVIAKLPYFVLHLSKFKRPRTFVLEYCYDSATACMCPVVCKQKKKLENGIFFHLAMS